MISFYEFHTSNNIQYETWDKATLNINEIIESDYDAIITNFDIKGIENKRIINISRMSIMQVVNELNKISIHNL
ncbi:conserved domain protein [Streptococcus infantis SK970]|nr:conserved domain protein [Streptococcus infantis SK970]